MKKHIKRLLISGAVMAAVTAQAPARAQISDNVVKLGVITDMTSVYSSLTGPGSVLAAQMAIDEFGGKVAGKQIVLLTADNQNKPEVASGIVTKWFDRDKVDVLLDIPNSAAALAVQQIAKEKKKVALFSGAAADRLTNADCSPYGINWTYDTYALSAGSGKAVASEVEGSWFFLAADYTFGHQLADGTAKVVQGLGRKVAGSVRHPIGTADFSSFLLQAQSSGAKVVALANAGTDTRNALKQANEFGLAAGGQKLVSLLFFENDAHSLGLQTAQGLILVTGFYWDMNEETRAWSKRFYAKHKAMPSMIQAGVYSSAMHYLKAVQATNSDDADTVLKWMRANKVNDMFAKNGTIRPDGRMVHDMYLAQVKTPAESKYPWDYFKILKTIPGEQAFRPLSESECPLVKK